MLNIAKLNDLKITWPVTLEVEKDTEIEIELDFKVLPDDQVKELALKGDRELLKGVLTGWKGISADVDNELEFNTENLETMSNFSFFRMQAVTAYYEAIATFARKNSKRR